MSEGRRRQRGRGSLAAAGAVLGAALLVGCADDPPAAQRADQAPGDYPDVNKVPSQAPRPPTPEELESVTQGLVADRDAARHVREGVRRTPQEIYDPDSPPPEPPPLPASALIVPPMAQPAPVAAKARPAPQQPRPVQETASAATRGQPPRTRAVDAPPERTAPETRLSAGRLSPLPAPMAPVAPVATADAAPTRLSPGVERAPSVVPPERPATRLSPGIDRPGVAATPAPAPAPAAPAPAVAEAPTAVASPAAAPPVAPPVAPTGATAGAAAAAAPRSASPSPEATREPPVPPMTRLSPGGAGGMTPSRSGGVPIPSALDAGTPSQAQKPTPPSASSSPSSSTGPTDGPIVVDSSGVRSAGTPKALAEYNKSGVSESSKVGEIYFGADAATLDANDQRVLREIAAFQRQYGGRLRVVGFVPPGSGTQGVASLKAAAQRADAVAGALVSAGVPAGQIFAGAMSEEQAAQGAAPASAAQTRRVEVFLDY